MKGFILGAWKLKKQNKTKKEQIVKFESEDYSCIYRDPFNCVIIHNKHRKIFSRLEIEYMP